MGNLSLNNALSGVLTSQSVIDVISQNVSNAEDEDYSRQKAIVNSNRPLFKDNKFFGAGVNLDEIVRQKSKFIENRLQAELHGKGQFSKLEEVLGQVETIIGEPSEEGIRGTFSDMNESLQNLANDPENRGARTDLIGKATSFTNTMKRINRQFQKLAGDQLGTLNDQIEASVNEINNIAQQVAELNQDISTSQGRGGNPNDLLDDRDALINDLSQIVDTEIKRDESEFRVTVKGFTLVQGDNAHQLSFETEEGSETPELFYDDPQQSKIEPKNGELKALFDLRSDIIPGFVDKLNDLAVQYVDRFNDLHQAGFGRDGQERNKFFSELPTRESGVFRLEGMSGTGGSIENQRAGFIDSPDTALVGDPSTPQAENFEDDKAVFSRNAAGDPIGNPTGKLQINQSVINYDMTEDSINDVIDRINEDDNQAEAYLSAENRLVIKGSQENDYQLDSLEDSGLLLDKTNVLRVGGSNRTSTQSIDDTSQALAAAANFGGDSRIDALAANPDGTTGRQLDLAEGTLEFESFNSPNFHVNYDTAAGEDSLDNIITRINSRAQSANSKIRAGTDEDNRLQMFAYEDSQSLGAGVTAGTDVTVSVSDAGQFERGQEVGFSDASNGEITTVKDVDVASNEITVDLANNYSTSGQVTTDFNSKFSVNDEASQRIETGPNPSSANNQVEVKDASVFNVGDEVRLSNRIGDTVDDDVTVTAVDPTNDQITLESSDISNPYTTGDVHIQKSSDTNRNRNLLSVMGMNRKMTAEQSETEFAIEGEKRKPPAAEQVAGLEVSEKIRNNPDLIAAAQGEDTDLDGIAEVTKGSGDGSNAQQLSGLQSERILKSGRKDPEEEINEFISGIGSQTSLAQREKSASETLVQDIKKQRQEISGVNIDQELTNMIQQQQLFQASSRIIQTVQELNQSVLGLL